MDVQFDEEQFRVPTYGFDEESKGIAGLLIRWGIAKNQKGVNIILLIIVVVFIVLTISIFAFSGTGEVVDDTAPEDNPDLII